MKGQILILIALTFILSAAVQTPEDFDTKYANVLSGKLSLNSDITKEMYEDYQEAFRADKHSDSIEMTNQRYEIFASKVAEVAAFNSEVNNTYTKGINRFSDMTDDEFFEHYNLDKTAEQKCSATATGKKTYVSKIPDSFDWREFNVVSPVKSQGHCGSCWTFSTIGALESHYYINTANRANFSEQVLVDCARETYDCHGCKGGLPSYAFNFIRDFGMTTNETYPYRAEDGECRYDNSTSVVTTSGPFNITSGDEGELINSIFNQGPVSVAFKVQGEFRDYKEGVYADWSCPGGPMDVNHAVLAVGYGTENGEPFLSIKNSWGAEWGDKGYFKILRNKNMCGIAVCNSYPLNVRASNRVSF